MNQILELLQELRPDSDFSSSEDFITDYLLDSFDIITLTAELEETYGIQIQTDDIVPENYQSVEAIANLVLKCGGTV
jgi:acyl carrier protein